MPSVGIILRQSQTRAMSRLIQSANTEEYGGNTHAVKRGRVGEEEGEERGKREKKKRQGKQNLEGIYLYINFIFVDYSIWCAVMMVVILIGVFVVLRI